MNKLLCPGCGKVSYTADTSQAQKCPYCVERFVVVENDFIDILRSLTSGNLKIILSRRQSERRKSHLPAHSERRVSDRRNGTLKPIPIGWLVTNHPGAAAF